MGYGYEQSELLKQRLYIASRRHGPRSVVIAAIEGEEKKVRAALARSVPTQAELDSALLSAVESESLPVMKLLLKAGAVGDEALTWLAKYMLVIVAKLGGDYVYPTTRDNNLQQARTYVNAMRLLVDSGAKLLTREAVEGLQAAAKAFSSLSVDPRDEKVYGELVALAVAAELSDEACR